MQNQADLKQLGIDEAFNGQSLLLQIFSDGLTAPETGRYISEYGITITRRVEVSSIEAAGAIDIKYFYPDGNLDATPEVSTIIPKIYKSE
ncbi:MAG: hypothetical protein JO235_20140 [Chroococcidiopsidaceae cyanobacterium CP_BM_RX_35]|nr:hypothetical protein [Chroococcidiopsidaceae cyanobacterium CP_BM_RX_35]